MTSGPTQTVHRLPATPPVDRSEEDDVVDVDPRFRLRRAQVRKQEGRRRFNRLAAVGAVAIVVGAAAALTHSPFLDVDEVEVSGTTVVTADEIRAAGGIGLGDPILYADLGAATRRIEALPWVARARVERSVPGSISVSIQERVPFALVSQDAGDVLVDDSGRVLAVADPAADDGLVRVVMAGDGPALRPGDTVDQGLDSAITLAGRLRENPAGAVAAVVVDQDLRLDLVEGGTVLFGDSRDLDEKVEDFRTLYARVDRTCLETIDVRVPGRSVLTRSEPCS